MEDQLWLVSFSDDDDRELTTLDIGNALAEGQISPATLVWRDGMAEWLSLNEVPELGGVIARHQAMTAALKKRQTVLGGFRAISPSAQQSPDAVTPPGTPNAAKATGTALGGGGPQVLPLPTAPHPTRAASTSKTAKAAKPAAEPARNNEPVGGFQSVPVRRRLSSSSGVDARTLEEAEKGGAADRSTTPPGVPFRTAKSVNPLVDAEDFSDLEDTPVSLDSSTLQPLEMEDLTSSIKSERLAAGSQDSAFAQSGSTSPSGEPGPAPRREPRPPQRTVPPSNPIRLNFDTVGVPLEPVLTNKPPESGSGKRLFLWSMAALATAAVGLAVFRPATSEDNSVTDAKPASQVYAVKAREPQAADGKEASPNAGNGEVGAAAQAVAANPASPAVADPVAGNAVSGVAAAPALNNAAAPQANAVAASPAHPAGRIQAPIPRAVPTTAALAIGASNAKPSSGTLRLTTTPNKNQNGTASRTLAPKASVKQPESGLEPKATPATAELASVSPEQATPSDEFNRDAAVTALDRAATEASACRSAADPSGVARVSVTFSETGRATMAIIDGPPFAGTVTGGCIAETMRKARVPTYKGDRVTVKKTVVIH